MAKAKREIKRMKTGGGVWCVTFKAFGANLTEEDILEVENEAITWFRERETLLR